MNNSEIYNVVKSLVGFKENDNSTSARTLISTLLPIDYASGYYLSNKAEFYDPMQDQIFYRNYKYDNEKSRVDSIEYINGRIDYYNRLCDDKFSKSGAIYDYIEPVVVWGVKVKLSYPILTDQNISTHSTTKQTNRIISNEYLY